MYGGIAMMLYEISRTQQSGVFQHWVKAWTTARFSLTLV
jgi:hypothetical protein